MQNLRSSRYNKKEGGKFSKPNSYREYKGKLEVPELTFQEKAKLRHQIEERQRSQKKRLMIGVGLGTVFAVVVAVWLVREINAVSVIETQIEDEFIEYQRQEYERYLSYGDEYMNQSQWYNAAFEYRTSLTFNPESEVALYRLTLSLMHLCETEDRGCNEALERLQDLEKTDVKPKDTNELRLRFEGINQRNSSVHL